jgi:alkylation response protein AidB-like acyl-CoA dehydrogenase
VDLALNDDQSELQRAARRFSGERVPLGGSLDQRAWADAIELGWLGMSVPENHDGAGASSMDLAVVFEELGRVAASTLLFDAAVLAPAILDSVDAPWSREALGAVLSGGCRPAVLIGDQLDLPSDGVTTLRFSAPSRQLSGSATGVRDATDATHFLVVAGDGSDVVCTLVEANSPGVSCTALTGFVPDHFRVGLDQVVVGQCSIVGGSGPELSALRAAVLRTVPVLCAYQVGSCQRAFELSVDYSRTRVQFGKAIGSFQRVQDHVINLINATDSCRWVTNHAVWCSEAGDDFASAVHVAKAVTAVSHRQACTSAHEVHAGIGADLQYGLAQHTFASRALYSKLGDPAWHRGRIAERLRTDASFG